MLLGKLTISPGFLMDFDAGLSGDIALAVLHVDNGTGEARHSAVETGAGGALGVERW